MAAAVSIGAMTLGELLDADLGVYTQTEISDLALDSRDITDGAAFVALAGERHHGLDFAEQALGGGAVVILCEPTATVRTVRGPIVEVPNLRNRLGEIAQRFYRRKATWPRLTGITGTNGKTTVAFLVSQALTRLQKTCGYIGTLGFGIPPQLAAHRLTTPDCLTLHKEIALMPVADVALEISSHALAQNRIDGLSIQSAVFTNLTRDHLDEHGEIAAYAEVKASLFRRPEIDQVVLNLDDPFAEQLRDVINPSARVLGTSVAQHDFADLYAVIDDLSLDGLSLSISGAYGQAQLISPLIGDFNAQNLLLALGALLNLDVPLAEACDALADALPPPGRMEAFHGSGDGPVVLVDYAHTPDALTRVLDMAAHLANREVYCVFGCGGDRDTGKREEMGQVAASRADVIIVTTDNPRTEDPQEIASAIVAGARGHPNLSVVLDRATAIRQAIGSAGHGDLVLVAGKGHEHTQLIGARSQPHDDRAIVMSALGGVT